MKPSLLLVGLGNPGKSYNKTRHNAGFLATDVLAEAFGTGEWKDAQKFQSVTQEARIGVVPVLLVRPQTYMNLSGEAVQKMVDFYKLDPRSQVIVFLDDIDIPLGDLRFKEKGSAGTHNGLKSIVDRFGPEVPRMRIGIGPKPEQIDLSAWVLSAFSAEEHSQLQDVIAEIPDKVKAFVLED